MPCPVPRWTEQVLVGFFPIRAAFRGELAGRHPRLHFRGLLRLHSRYGLQDRSPPDGGLLSRGFDPAGCPAKPLGSYHVSPTTTQVDPPSTDDLPRWGAQLTKRAGQLGECKRLAAAGQQGAQSALFAATAALFKRAQFPRYWPFPPKRGLGLLAESADEIGRAHV